jgi:hypothetical protein
VKEIQVINLPFAYVEVDDKPIPVGFKKAFEIQGTGEYKKIRKRVKSGEFYKKDEVIDDGFYKNGKPKTKKIKVDDETRPKYKWIEEKGPEIMKKVEVQGEPKYKKKIILQGDRILTINNHSSLIYFLSSNNFNSSFLKIKSYANIING